ncbi:TetR/AcrR family transcriptional regulator [Aquimarina rhabdastrellae]
MKQKIIETASEMFLSYGFKSVTMDDLASNIGISKKTIYAHFSNKTKLVEATTQHSFDTVCSKIDIIIDADLNPIEELYTIKAEVIKHLKYEKNSPSFQLQKYYPKIYQEFRTKQFKIMQECILNNLDRGIASGIFRKEIDTQIISRIYFMGMTGIKDQDLFPLSDFSVTQLMAHYLEYHVRGISTEKGLTILKNFTNN